jgi:hypothetical protein
LLTDVAEVITPNAKGANYSRTLVPGERSEQQMSLLGDEPQIKLAPMIL